MRLGSWIVVIWGFGTWLAIIRLYYCLLAKRPFFGRFLHGLIPRVIIKIRTIRYLRRLRIRRSLKAHDHIAGFKGMTGIDGTPRASMQCRSWIGLR